MSTSNSVDSKSIPLAQRILALQARNRKQLHLFEVSRTSQSDGNKENSLLSSSVSFRQNRTAPAEHVFDHSKINESVTNAQNIVADVGRSAEKVLYKSHNKCPPSASKQNCLSTITEKENRSSRFSTSEQQRYGTEENQLKSRSKSVGTVASYARCESTSQPANVMRSSISTPALQNKHMVINGHNYIWLNLLGKGGSSRVYEVFGETQSEVCALKVVDLGDDPSLRQCYLNEIELLKNLQGSPYIIKMIEYELRESENTLYVVMEKGDIDLATFLKTRRTEIDFAFIKYHWNEMLRCVKVIHDRKIVHSDLKPANFLLVKGTLKLIDFGIAAGISNDMTAAVKERQMGTLSYMAPEVLQGEGVDGKFKIPLKADVWSLGCILYNMVYGHLPFPMKNQSAKVAAILNPEYTIDFSGCRDSVLVDVLKCCLVRDVQKRANVNDLLEHPYLTERLAPADDLHNSDLCGPKLDYLAIAKELQNNTPNTVARRLEQLTRGSQTFGGSSFLMNTVKKKSTSSCPFGEGFYGKITKLLLSKEPSAIKELKECVKLVSSAKLTPSDEFWDSGDEISSLDPSSASFTATSSSDVKTKKVIGERPRVIHLDIASTAEKRPAAKAKIDFPPVPEKKRKGPIVLPPARRSDDSDSDDSKAAEKHKNFFTVGFSLARNVLRKQQAHQIQSSFAKCHKPEISTQQINDLRFIFICSECSSRGSSSEKSRSSSPKLLTKIGTSSQNRGSGFSPRSGSDISATFEAYKRKRCLALLSEERQVMKTKAVLSKQSC
ncbi:kinase domain protein [Dictyocaulus viviparus]|uniref:Kinase domain protein n=1 Tax=Dictyocaulus viviparus TaxID=29172 RepID=A0A0D8Y4L5_DICVI|nr:kinase domain protein [Dictyocaulus viviparus]